MPGSWITFAVLLPFALAMASCGSPQAINRESSDFIALEEPSPLDRARAAVFPDAAEWAVVLRHRADLVVDYDRKGTMRAEAVSGKPVDAEVTPAFLARQKRKALVVIVVYKTAWSADEETRHISFLNDHFTRHGYRRVVVLLAVNNPNGNPILSETARPGSSRPKFQRRWDP